MENRRPSGRGKKSQPVQVKKNFVQKSRTLTVIHADGTKQVVTPNVEFFDGDFKTLAISLAKPKERITWTIV